MPRGACISAAYAVRVEISVCLSVHLVSTTIVYIVSKRVNLSSNFFTFGSRSILVFQYQNL